MTLLGLLHAARSSEVVFASGVVFALLLVGTTDANEGCGNTPDDSQMMSVLKQAADMFMPCIEGLYNMPVHGTILEEAIQGVCRNYDKCNEIRDTLGACLVETTAEYLSTIKDFPYDPNVMAEKTLVSWTTFTMCAKSATPASHGSVAINQFRQILPKFGAVAS